MVPRRSRLPVRRRRDARERPARTRARRGRGLIFARRAGRMGGICPLQRARHRLDPRLGRHGRRRRLLRRRRRQNRHGRRSGCHSPAIFRGRVVETAPAARLGTPGARRGRRLGRRVRRP